MPSEDLLRRLEALNGGPLREALQASTELPAAACAGESDVAVVRKPAATSRKSRPRKSDFISLGDALPGTERLSEEGSTYFHIERPLAHHLQWCAVLGKEVCEALPGVRSGRTRRAQKPLQPSEVAFFDVETTGLDMTSCIFLLGILKLDASGNIVCTQLLARSPEEESAALAAAANLLAEARMVVSYNGRSFDMPLLRSRVDHHGLAFTEPAAHVDMLLEARKRYSRKLPNCRLLTLEERVCGRTREDDVPSSRIPGVYRQFVKTGDAGLLERVVHHNLLDLATTAELFTLFFR